MDLIALAFRVRTTYPAKNTGCLAYHPVLSLQHFIPTSEMINRILAHLRDAIDVMRPVSFMREFQALQQASMILL
jgi:hypothetical protein